jgi:hypothetical protein
MFFCQVKVLRITRTAVYKQCLIAAPKTFPLEKNTILESLNLPMILKKQESGNNFKACNNVSRVRTIFPVIDPDLASYERR